MTAIADVIPREDRHIKMLALLGKHKGKIAPAAIEAGFSEKTAYSKAKSLMRTALKKQAKIADLRDRELGDVAPTMTAKQMSTAHLSIHEKVGLSVEDTMKEYRFVLEQRKDLTNKLKAMSPLLREQGIELQPDVQNNLIVPTLSIGVREKAPQLEPIKAEVIQISPPDAQNSPENKA